MFKQMSNSQATQAIIILQKVKSLLPALEYVCHCLDRIDGNNNCLDTASIIDMIRAEINHRLGKSYTYITYLVDVGQIDNGTLIDINDRIIDATEYRLEWVDSMIAELQLLTE